ncbi:MAG: PfkB family carbohydrate kinase [Spirochaetaceae bacterium]|jgi:tagatose 6-phosphate kinase|nr:PfkB family carbohydrate kinase [Spirochaetaceae bacterium]
MSFNILVLSLNPTLQKTSLFTHGWKRGQVNRCSQYNLTISGKGANCARILAQLGNNVSYLTQLGGRNRDFFIDQMRQDGVKMVWAESDSEIRYCHTLISQEPHDATEIVEEGEPVGEQCDSSVRDCFIEALSVADMLVIIGSKAPGFSDNIYLDCAKIASEQKIPLVLDINNKDLPQFLELNPKIIKINSFEFLQSFVEDFDNSQPPEDKWIPLMEEKLRELSSQGHDFIITQGAGEILMAQQGNIERFNPMEMELVNPIGCGDAMTAGIASALGQGVPLEGALHLGMECSRKNGEVLTPGSIVKSQESE